MQLIMQFNRVSNKERQCLVVSGFVSFVHIYDSKCPLMIRVINCLGGGEGG